MKIRTRLIATAIAALIPLWVGIIAITFVGRESERVKTVQLMEEYAKATALSIESFFVDAIDAATYLATVQGDAMLEWHGEQGAGQLFAKIVRMKEAINRISFLDLDGHIYDAYSTGIEGNPWQGGRRTENNSVPNSPPVVLTDRDYFRALVTENPRGEFRVMVSEPYIPRGLSDKHFITSASVISNGQPAGVVNVAQTSEDLSRLYASLSADLMDKFGTNSHTYLVSHDMQLVSELEYNAETEIYEDVLSGRNEIVPVTVLEEGVVSAIDAALRGEGRTVTATIHGEAHFLAGAGIEGTPLAVCIATSRANMLSASRTMLILASVLFFLITFSMLTGINVVTRVMRASLGSMDGTMQEIAEGGGDLTVRLEVRGNDEIAAVSEKFNRFMGTLHAMVEDVNESAKAMEVVGETLSGNAAAISGGVSSISKDIGDLNFAAEEQSASVTETSATITQIAQNIESLTSQIESQSTAVTQSSASVQEMVSNISSLSQSISKASGSFEELKGTAADGKGSINNVQELVNRLSAQSDSLLEANSVIDNIAAQTNLLAMNAAIEAAHAGEAGRGFAVVADEIRKLAASSSEQSKSIAAGLKNTIESIKNIAQATAIADDAFDSVSSKIDAVTALVSEINLAMQEQSSGSRQVLEALSEIEGVTVQVRDGAVEMNTGTETILKEITRLSGISQQVQDRSASIAKAAEAISGAVAEIVRNAASNKDAVDMLVDITSKFKL